MCYYKINIFMAKLKEVMNEAVILGRHMPKSPLKDSDTIRVYHGAFDIETVITALKYGLSGDQRANRRYSFEADNNPRGLFVTPELSVAEEFGNYVIEFHTKVSDLEAPVWPDGSYTVQGQMTQSFDGDDNRELAKAAQKARISKNATEYVIQSDSPDVAYWLMDTGETQALFTGNLNRNSIRAVWVSPNPYISSRVQSFNRMRPQEFLKEFGSEDGLTSEKMQMVKNRLVSPREDIDLETLIQRYLAKFKHLKRDQIITILKDHPDYIDKAVWNSKQAKQVRQDLDKIK